MFDGQIKVEEGTDPKTKYREVIEARRPDSTRIKLSIESADTNGGNINITLRTIATDTVTANTVRLFVIIIQDSMPYGLVGPLCFVARKVIPPDTLGINIPDSLRNEPNDTFNITLGTPNIWHNPKLGVISFIQDISTKKVIQAVIKRKL